MTHRIHRKITLSFLTILAALTILSCNINSSDTATNQACRIIQHAQGETCVPESPQRIVTISDYTLYHSLFLGVEPVGSAFDDWREQVPAYIKSEQDTIGRIEKLGQQSQPNIEKILKLKPDLIISWGDVQSVYPLLSQISPTVIDSLASSGNSGWQDHFNFVAKVLGKDNVAQQAWSDYYQHIEKLKVALGNQYKNHKVSILTVAHDFKNHALTKQSFIGNIFNDVGIQLAAAQNVDGNYGWIDFSTEEFVDFFDGDILFVTVTGDADRQMLEELKKMPFWEKLQAVQQGRVYLVDSLTWQGGNFFAAYAVINDLYRYLIDVPWPNEESYERSHPNTALR